MQDIKARTYLLAIASPTAYANRSEKSKPDCSTLKAQLMLKVCRCDLLICQCCRKTMMSQSNLNRQIKAKMTYPYGGLASVIKYRLR